MYVTNVTNISLIPVKGVIRISKSNKDRQHNAQKKKKGQKDKQQFATTHAVNVKLIFFNKD